MAFLDPTDPRIVEADRLDRNADGLEAHAANLCEVALADRQAARRIRARVSREYAGAGRVPRDPDSPQVATGDLEPIPDLNTLIGPPLTVDEAREFIADLPPLSDRQDVLPCDAPRTPDFPRWCEVCQKFGNHHTDRHPTGDTSPAEPGDGYLNDDPNCQCWNEGQYGRVHREDCPIHGPQTGMGECSIIEAHEAEEQRIGDLPEGFTVEDGRVLNPDGDTIALTFKGPSNDRVLTFDQEDASPTEAEVLQALAAVNRQIQSCEVARARGHRSQVSYADGILADLRSDQSALLAELARIRGEDANAPRNADGSIRRCAGCGVWDGADHEPGCRGY